MTDSERRQEARKKERLALVFHYAQEKCEVNTLDVSRGGTLLQTPVLFPSGTLLILECPSLCSQGQAIRLLAKVVRATKGFTERQALSGMGLAWVRAYSSSGEEHLKEFLIDKLGYDAADTGSIQQAPTGDFVYDFPKGLEPLPSETGVSDPTRLSDYQDKREHLITMQRGRFKLDVPIIYSVHNMHYRGTLMALGPGGLAVHTKGALPFEFSKVTVRYPLESGPASPRIILFCETEMVLEQFGNEPGFFSARTLGIDELDNPTIFRMHLRALPQKYPRW